MRKGFTLLELIVIIVILGVLGAVAIPTFQRVIERSQGSAVEAEVRGLLAETEALARLEERSPGVEDVAGAVGDSSVHRLLPTGQASRHVRWVSSAEDQEWAGVAVMGASSRCTLGRADGAVLEVWTEGNLGANCTGETALLGPGSKVDYTAPSELEFSAPASLVLTSPGPGEVEGSWEAVPGASQYRVELGDVIQLVTDPAVRASGLMAGETLVTVRALGGSGEPGPASGSRVIVRGDGPWDARLVWQYDGNTACYGGASSWTWQMIVSSPVGESGQYRAEVRYSNEVSPGVSAWGGVLLQEHSPGYLTTPEVQVCAPAGNPDPPFTAAKVSTEATRQDVVLGRTGEVLLQAAQIERRADRADLAVSLPER